MNKKQVLRLVSFLLIVAVIIVVLCDLFEYPNSYMSERFNTFDHLEKDTVDAIYVGTSGVDRFWIGAKAYDEYGMAVYPLSIDGLPAWTVLDTVKYGIKKQHPKLFIIDVRPFTWAATDNVSLAEKRSRRVTDVYGFFSPTRFSAISRSNKLLGSVKNKTFKFDLSFYLPFIRYHGGWSEDTFTFDEIGTKPSKHLGFFMDKVETLKITELEEPLLTKEVGKMDSNNEKYLVELIDYLKENDIDAIFVASPKLIDETIVYINNATFKLIEDAGFPTLNFSSPENVEKYPFDYKNDFYDKSHSNIVGAEKYTAYFSEYLKENYDFEDHRNDPKYKQWNGVYDRIKRTVDKWKVSAEKQKQSTIKQNQEIIDKKTVQ